ncbi:MAG TPA: hypothetical protein VFV52_09540 [Bacilli bacterium]|nr:hypothetical protein [Bacilli bacterium]
MLAFLQDYWVLFLLAIVALFIVRMIFKAVFKIALIAAGIGLVLVFVFHFSASDVLQKGQDAAGLIKDASVETVVPLLQSEMKDADISFQPDGTYEVKTTHVRVIGKKGEPTATLYYGDFHFEINVSQLGDVVQQQLEQAQAQQS